MKRPRGTGSIFRMKGSSHWWIKYRHDGKVFRESSGSAKKWAAENLLKDRLKTADTEKFVTPEDRQRTVRDLLEPFRPDYLNNERKSWHDAEARWRLHLEPVFGGIRALSVTQFHVEQYKNARKQAGASNASLGASSRSRREQRSQGFRR